MNKRINELLNFVSRLYKPVGTEDEIKQLEKLIVSGNYRAIDKADEDGIFYDCLVIHTKGRGLRETYKGFSVCRIDVGSVGGKTAAIAVYDEDMNFAKPAIIAKGNIRYNLSN